MPIKIIFYCQKKKKKVFNLPSRVGIIIILFPLLLFHFFSFCFFCSFLNNYTKIIPISAMDDKSTSGKVLSHFNPEDVVREDYSLSTVVVDDIEKKSISNTPTEEEPPNGGWSAWLSVFGGFCVSS